MSEIVCVLLPRLALAVAAGGRGALLRAPAALAPEPGGPRRVGEVSRAAGAMGIHTGMPLGEALARCPELALVPPDPAAVEAEWERLLGALEGIGAEVESERPGSVCFRAAGLRRLHAGSIEGVISAARRALRAPAGVRPRVAGRLEVGSAGAGAREGADAGARADADVRVGAGARIGAAPSRFCAYVAASRARPRRAEIVAGGVEDARAYLAPLPVALLRWRPALEELPETLEQLGIRTLGELAALPRAALADRFGAAGIAARELARGRDGPASPRRPSELLEERLELPEAVSGPQLEHALGLLVDRLLARPERAGRTLRSATLAAVLVEGGSWHERVAFREASCDPLRLRLALVPRLAVLPAPAEELRLRADDLGPPAAVERSLLDASVVRRARLGEAIGQARAAAGPEAALRVLLVDPDSRVPERRAVLTPFEGHAGEPGAQPRPGGGGRPSPRGGGGREARPTRGGRSRR